MRDFQSKLNEELEKRGLGKKNAPVEPSSPPPADSKPKKIKKPRGSAVFSWGAFLKGSVACTLFLGGVLLWAWFKAPATSALIQEKLGSKTAVVKISDTDIEQDNVSTQPVIKMAPAAEEENIADEQHAPEVGAADDAEAALNGPLVTAPIQGLYETTAAGPLPMIRKEDNLSPFQAYKKPFKKTADKPVLSIIIADLGLSTQTAEKIIQDMPENVTLSFSPYARDLKILSDKARADGHEVWLTLPLETEDYPKIDPGPSTLLMNASVEQNRIRLVSVLSRAQGYAGFVSQKDHIFRQEDAAVNPVIEEIFQRGLAIIDSNTASSSFVEQLAGRHDYPHTKNNFWLDDDLTPLALNQKIRQMIEYGQGTGHVVMMLKPYPASLQALDKFLKSQAAAEFQIAPASAQVSYGT